MQDNTDRKRTNPANTSRRQQILMTAMAVTAIVAIVTVVVGPWRGGDVNQDVTPGRPELLVPQPPETDTSRPHIIVRPQTVPVDGADVALILANPTPEEAFFGVSGLLQRWNGSTWSDHRQVVTGTGPDQSPGRLHSLDEQVIVPMIALSAPARGFAQPVWTHVQDIDAGWYRFKFNTATGIFQVSDTPSEKIVRSTTPIGFSGISVVQAGSAAKLELEAFPRTPISGSFDLDQHVGDYTSTARIERLDGDRWVVIPSDTVQTVNGTPANGSFVVQLPELETGVYRVSREASVAGRVESLFWSLPLS
ncbi:hypothetical protein [Kineosporia babensis]|uniref:Uncharacterized protein n=1 Tax=Kineosporia babensis TaxID=499548 RepID=A0A9X1NK80_9ACTN|nr:hypothetical protein [Kineosporia babensis]MCD5316567.1 hypothetical protein [Kineosporia babensis]